MTILVTGGLGYIGSHTVVELLQNNFQVIIVDDMSNSEKFILDNIEKIGGKRPVFFPFDLRRKDLISQVFDAYEIDGCIHFAAFKAVGESQEKPLDYYENNLFSLINVLQEFKARNISNFIFKLEYLYSFLCIGEAKKETISNDFSNICRRFLPVITKKNRHRHTTV